MFVSLNPTGTEGPSRGTVQKYVKEYKNHWRKVLRPVDWGNLPECGLPETALDVLLRIWSDTWEHSRLPTVIEAQWWWRVSCALPGAQPAYVRRAAQQFVWREALRLLGDTTVPANDNDLWGAVAARSSTYEFIAWVVWDPPIMDDDSHPDPDTERRLAYQRHIEQGRLQPIKLCMFFAEDRLTERTIGPQPRCLYDLPAGWWVWWSDAKGDGSVRPDQMHRLVQSREGGSNG